MKNIREREEKLRALGCEDVERRLLSFFKKCVVAPSKPFRSDVLSTYLSKYYKSEEVHQIIKILLDTKFLNIVENSNLEKFLIEHPDEDPEYREVYVKFRDFRWLYEYSFDNINFQYSFLYRNIRYSIDDLLYDCKNLIITLDYYSNVYSDKEFFDTNTFREVLERVNAFSSSEENLIESIHNLRSSIEVIANNIRRTGIIMLKNPEIEKDFPEPPTPLF